MLLPYYTDEGKLIYAGRVGTGMPVKVLADLRRPPRAAWAMMLLGFAGLGIAGYRARRNSAMVA